MATGVMAMRNGRGRDPLGRALAWWWRRRAARGADPAKVLRLTRRRRRALEDAARRASARIAADAAISEGDAGAGWLWRPTAALAPGPRTAMVAPPSGAALAEGLAVHHDASGAAFLLSMRPGAGRPEIAFESYEYDGAYLSFALTPPRALRPPRPDETLTLKVEARASRPIKAFARLNMSGAGGAERLHAEGVVGDGVASFGFDLAFAPFAPGGEDALWIDLILDRPRMLELVVADIALKLRPTHAGRGE